MQTQNTTSAAREPIGQPILTLDGLKPRTRETFDPDSIPVGPAPGPWIVWGAGLTRPRKMHRTESSACVEAKRLAALNPGIRYQVFRLELVRVERR
jgi:hypothetical protein